MDPIAAWPWCILLLVVSIRGFIAPLTYLMYRSTRRSINLRPTLADIRKKYEDQRGSAARRQMALETRKAQRDAGVRSSVGCLIGIIQAPFFLGLYQVLIHMARPADNGGAYKPIGLLTSQDVADFLKARFLGVPMNAHSMLPEDAWAAMGTTHSHYLHAVIPLIAMASIFTTVNMGNSVYRMWKQTDHTSAGAAGMVRIMAISLVLVAISPWWSGLFGPVPMAIFMYWVSNNLWTTAQSIGFYVWLDRVLPYTEEYLEHWAQGRVSYKEKMALKRAARRRRWLRRLGYVVTPWRIPTLWADGRAQKAEKKEAKLQRKEEKRKRREEDRAADQAAKEAEAKAKSCSSPEAEPEAGEPAPEQS